MIEFVPGKTMKLEYIHQIKELLTSGDKANTKLAFEILKGFDVPNDTDLHVALLKADFKKAKGLLLRKGFYKALTVNSEGIALNISSSDVRSIHSNIKHLPMLEELNLANNPLTFLPQSLTHLQQLREFNLVATQLTSLPEWLADLPNIETLYMGGSSIITIPAFVQKMKRLQKISLSLPQTQRLIQNYRFIKHIPEVYAPTNELQTLPNIKSIQPFYIKETTRIPKIIFDAQQGIFEISGRLLLENSITFVHPILQWLEVYSLVPNQETIVHIKIDYFNSGGSGLALKRILKKLEQIPNTRILWFYEDEDVQESGEDFAELIDILLSW